MWDFSEDLIKPPDDSEWNFHTQVSRNWLSLSIFKFYKQKCRATDYQTGLYSFFFFKRQAFGSDLHFSKDLIKPPNGYSGISNTRFLKRTFTFSISILQTCRATDYQTGLLLYLLLYPRPSLISRFFGLFLFSFIKLLTVAIHVLYSSLTRQSCNWKITLNQFG